MTLGSDVSHLSLLVSQLALNGEKMEALRFVQWGRLWKEIYFGMPQMTGMS